jgi:hypothetical protein
MADIRKSAVSVTPASPALQSKPAKPDFKNESKEAKFVRLATRRVVRAKKDILAIGHLANRSAYIYTQEQVNKILDTLDKAVDTIRAKFSGNKENGEMFSL